MKFDLTNADLRDVIAGSLMAISGAAITAYTVLHYPLGTGVRLQPGAFPAIIGAFLTLFGVLLAVPALFRSGEAIGKIDWRAAGAVFAAILSFALLIDRVGLLPTIVIMTFIASLADNKLGFWGTLAVAALLAALAALIFRIGLGVPIPLYRWSW